MKQNILKPEDTVNRKYGERDWVLVTDVTLEYYCASADRM
jgi:hypothetical protein